MSKGEAKNFGWKFLVTKRALTKFVHPSRVRWFCSLLRCKWKLPLEASQGGVLERVEVQEGWKKSRGMFQFGGGWSILRCCPAAVDHTDLILAFVESDLGAKQEIWDLCMEYWMMRKWQSLVAEHRVLVLRICHRNVTTIASLWLLDEDRVRSRVKLS